jgi:hypothetical protein
MEGFMSRGHLGAAAMLVISLTAACATGPSSTGRVTFQLSTVGANSSASLVPLPDVTITRGLDVLVITQVQLVARKIEFERVEGSCAVPVPSEGSDGEGEHDDGENDDGENDEGCPELRLGPLLLKPPLSDGAETTFSVDLPAGQYEEVELKIHKPTESSGDAAFLLAHPDFLGVSIKVTGIYNGDEFTFTTDVSSKVEVEFDTPITVTVDGMTNVTLLMDVREWFLQAGGASLVNPIALTEGARDRIEQNIRASFHAFRDQDCDGHRD